MEPDFIQPDNSIPRAIPRPGAGLSRTHAENQLGISEVVTKLTSAIAVVEGRISINPASRVGRWRAAVERMEAAGGRAVLRDLVRTLQTTGHADHPFRESFLALTESRQFIAIVENLVDHLEDGDLRKLVRGSPVGSEKLIAVQERTNGGLGRRLQESG